VSPSPTEVVARFIGLKGGEVYHDPDGRPGLWVALPSSFPVFLDPAALEARARAWVEAGACDPEGNPLPRPHRKPRPKTARPLLLAKLLWPPSTNRLWRAAKGRVHLDPKAREWRERAQWALEVRWGRQEALEGPVVVHLVAVPPDRRRRDVDNLAKAVLDAMNGVVIGDDSQVARLILNRTDPQAPGHVLVRVFRYRRPWEVQTG